MHFWRTTGEAAVARAVAEIDAAAFVLDVAQNNSDTDSLGQVYDPFIGILRERHPETPVVAITPIYAAVEATGSRKNEQMRALIRKVVSKRIPPATSISNWWRELTCSGPLAWTGWWTALTPTTWAQWM